MQDPAQLTADNSLAYYLKGRLKFYQPNLQGSPLWEVVQHYQPLLRMSNGHFTSVRFWSINGNVGTLQLGQPYDVVVMCISLNQEAADFYQTPLEELFPVGGPLNIYRPPMELLGEGIIHQLVGVPEDEWQAQLRQREVEQQQQRQQAYDQLMQQPHQLLILQLRQHLLNQLKQLPTPERQRYLVDACANNDLPAVQQALQAGALPQPTHDGEPSPLIYAADNGNVQMAVQLIARGAKVNYHDDMGDSALAIAALHGDETMVCLLLQFGARNQPDHDDMRPSDNADLKGHHAIAQLIRTYVRPTG